MAYKLLGRLLPVDIVNKILDYSVYYSKNELLLHKMFNLHKIQMIGLYKNDKIFDLQETRGFKDDIKKYNYAQTCLYYENTIGYGYTCGTRDIYNYIYLHVIRCDKCNHNYCTKCDFSACKDNEIFKNNNALLTFTYTGLM